jgi:hypothetical protein
MGYLTRKSLELPMAIINNPKAEVTTDLCLAAEKKMKNSIKKNQNALESISFM